MVLIFFNLPVHHAVFFRLRFRQTAVPVSLIPGNILFRNKDHALILPDIGNAEYFFSADTIGILKGKAVMFRGKDAAGFYAAVSRDNAGHHIRSRAVMIVGCGKSTVETPFQTFFQAFQIRLFPFLHHIQRCAVRRYYVVHIFRALHTAFNF